MAIGDRTRRSSPQQCTLTSVVMLAYIGCLSPSRRHPAGHRFPARSCDATEPVLTPIATPGSGNGRFRSRRPSDLDCRSFRRANAQFISRRSN